MKNLLDLWDVDKVKAITFFDIRRKADYELDYPVERKMLEKMINLHDELYDELELEGN